MPYKLIREGKAGAKAGGKEKRREKAKPDAKPDAKADAKPEAKPDAKADAKPEGAQPPDAKPDAKRPHDVFLDNEWTQLVLKALHRTLQKVEARCGVSKRLLDASSDDEGDTESAKGTTAAPKPDDAKELKDATLAAWAELAGTVPHLDTAANYVLGMYLHTLAPPDVDFVVLLPRLPPWEVVLLAFVNNMHDNRPALVKYWTLPLRLKTRVLADNLTSVMKKLVGPCMKRVRTDGTREAAASEDEDDPPVRTVYLDEAHPLSKGAGK
jgi:hypothetical protein